MPWTGRPDRPVRVKGSPTATSSPPRAHGGVGAQGPGPAVGVPEPDGGRRVGRAPDQGEAVPVRAQRGDGDARLRQRLRASLGIQPDQRVPPGGGHAGDERPVGRLGHGLLASTQSGPWNSASTAVKGTGSSSSARTTANAGRAATNPTGPRRSAATRPGPRRAGRPTPPRRRPPAARAPTAWSVSCSCSGRPGGTTSGNSRTVEASQGMSGWSQATTARRSPAGCGRGVPKKSCPSSRVVSQGDPTRVERATTLRTGRADPSRWTSRTASTHSPSAVALSPP